jgi:hypothetical protein
VIPLPGEIREYTNYNIISLEDSSNKVVVFFSGTGGTRGNFQYQDFLQFESSRCCVGLLGSRYTIRDKYNQTFSESFFWWYVGKLNNKIREYNGGRRVPGV